MTGAAAPAREHAAPSARPERYIFEARLDRNATGPARVWLALDARLSSRVVCTRYSTSEAEHFARHLQLVRSGAPHMPSVIDVYSEPDGSTVLVRSFVEGRSLRTILDGPSCDSLEAVAALAIAVQSLHGLRPTPCPLGGFDAEDVLIDDRKNVWILPGRSAVAPESGMSADLASLVHIALRAIGAPEPFCAATVSSAASPALASAMEHALSRGADKLAARRIAESLRAIRPNEFATNERVVRAPEAITRWVDPSDSRVAHALESLPGSSQLGWMRLASAGLDLGSRAGDYGLKSLDTLDIDLYAHQLRTAAALVSGAMSAGAILADEVGLGKTIEALLICQELRIRGGAQSVLIVAPPSSAAQWLAETRLRMRRTVSERGFRLYQGVSDAEYPLLIVSSATLRQERRAARILARHDDLVIVDEAHQCCGPDGELTALGRAVAQLERRRLLLLTATPLGSNPKSLETLADLIQPGICTSGHVLGGHGRDAESARLPSSYLGQVLIRHRRSELAEIVAPTINYSVDRVPCAQDKIAHAANRIACEWRGERVVVFARSSALRKSLCERVARLCPGRSVIAFAGSRRHGKAQERTFNDYADAVIVSGDAVCDGMNWQRARCMAHLDIPVQPVIWEQRIGRIYRLGQRSDRIDVAHYVVADSTEAQILALYAKSLGMFSLPVGEASSVLSHLGEPQARDFEGVLRGSVCSGAKRITQLSALAQPLQAARAAYDRSAARMAELDDALRRLGGS